jgi:acyl-coenzyme A thioesterase PaaI-like protein
MGFGQERDGDDRLLLTMAYGVDKMGRPGFLHGGAIAGMLESIAYLTLDEALGKDGGQGGGGPVAAIKPVNVTVTFMRGGGNAKTYARATIERLGRRIANIEAIAWQEDAAKPIAVAQMNVMIDRG